MPENRKRRKLPFKMFMLFFAAVFCELFLFNFKWIHSAFDREIAAVPVITGADSPDGCVYTAKESFVTVEFPHIDQEIKYLYVTPGHEFGNKTVITVSAKDEANENYFSAPGRTVLSDVEQSQYIRLHFSGRVRSLKIVMSEMEGKTFQASDVRLNVRVPLMFSWKRLFALVILGMALFVLRPGSSLYQYRTDLTRKKQRLAVMLLLAVYAAVFWGMLHWNTSALDWSENMEHHQQYYKLVDAFRQGRLYTDDDVSEELKNMENPYDRYAREAGNVSFKWDHAYYEGKYYCYFGAVPALLLYLPYNLLTGGNLPNHVAVFIFGVLFMAGTAWLLWELIRKWYRGIPFVLYLVLHAVFVAVSGIAYAIYKPDFYIVPIISALMFAVWGLSAWLSAENAAHFGAKKLCSWKLMAGSLCIALTAGCRPQFLAVAFFGVIFFWNDVFKERILFSRNSRKQTAALCLPFLIVGAAVMWYNVARFGSPFDFGANYNLTTNDMTHRGFVFGRTGLGIFTCFLQPVVLGAVFPFLTEFGVSTVYQGLTLTENLMGGVLWLYPILFTGVYGVFRKSIFAEKRIRLMVYLATVMAVILAVLDVQMAGLLTRYYLDFAWLLMLASVLTAFALYDKYSSVEKEKQGVIRLFVMLSLVTLLLAFFSILAHREDSIRDANPVLFYEIQHLIAFWM